MTTATIEISAQFGGRDAAAAVLPHFRALKAAAQSIVLDPFPFAKLAFILRVDGEVNAYGLAGAGNVDLDRKGEYVSVDMGIPVHEWSSLRPSELANSIEQAINSSVELLRHGGGGRLQGIDFETLENTLKAFCTSYRSKFLVDAS
jgi:hypothetical protein